MKPIVIIGYSGHAYVVIDLLQQTSREVAGYCDIEEKIHNPFSIPYLGSEKDKETLARIANYDLLITIGDNDSRESVYHRLTKEHNLISLIHPRATISPTARLGRGTIVFAGALVNTLADIGSGTIINSGSIIEHECLIGDFVHVAPGAVLTGKVRVGHKAFIGANATIKPGISIGEGAIVGAGTVVLHDVPDHTTVVGNPQKSLHR